MGSQRPARQMALGEESSYKRSGQPEFSSERAARCAGWALGPLIRWPAWSAALSSRGPSSQVSLRLRLGPREGGWGRPCAVLQLSSGLWGLWWLLHPEGPLLRADAC